MSRFLLMTIRIWQHLDFGQKCGHSFISFDIVDFYPSISENLLDQALSWASSLADILDEHISIIKHARKSPLFNNGKQWIKIVI